MRAYGPADHLAAVRLLSPMLQKLYPGGEAWLEGRLNDVTEGRASCILAVRAQELAGIIIMTPKKPTLVKLSTLYVAPVMRGVGIGKQLLESALERLRSDGVDQVYITAAHSVRHQISPLLTTYGFTYLDCSPSRYGPGRHEDIYKAWL